MYSSLKLEPYPSILTVPNLTVKSCKDEEKDESPEHFFRFCPVLSNRRLRSLGKPFLNDRPICPVIKSDFQDPHIRGVTTGLSRLSVTK
ncbi:hypothetical protein ACLKA7_008229 [Drosophila subpalustris]